MEKQYTVYMHENKTNHKKYIGITSQDVNARWNHGTNYKSCHAIRRAFEKYGWDGFDHVILFDGLTKQEACEKEIQLISEYDTRNPEHGYNICVGGGGTSGSVVSADERKRRSEFWKGEHNPNYKGRLCTTEWVEKMRQINIGSKHTDEHKRKISESLKGHEVSEKSRQAVIERNKKAVIRDDGVCFATVNEAAVSVGVTPSAISNAMRRGNKSGGYYWRHAELKA